MAGAPKPRNEKRETTPGPMAQEIRVKRSLPYIWQQMNNPDNPVVAANMRVNRFLDYLSPDPITQARQPNTLTKDIANFLGKAGAYTYSFVTGEPVQYTPRFPEAMRTYQDPIEVRNQIALGGEPKYLRWVLQNLDDIEAGKVDISGDPDLQNTYLAVKQIMQAGEDIPALGIDFDPGATSLAQARVIDPQKYQLLQSAPEVPRGATYSPEAARANLASSPSSPLDDIHTRKTASVLRIAFADLVSHPALLEAEKELGRDPFEVANLYWNYAYRFIAEAWGMNEAQKAWLRGELSRLATQWAASGSPLSFGEYLKQQAEQHAGVLYRFTGGEPMIAPSQPMGRSIGPY